MGFKVNIFDPSELSIVWQQLAVGANDRNSFVRSWAQSGQISNRDRAANIHSCRSGRTVWCAKISIVSNLITKAIVTILIDVREKRTCGSWHDYLEALSRTEKWASERDASIPWERGCKVVADICEIDTFANPCNCYQWLSLKRECVCMWARASELVKDVTRRLACLRDYCMGCMHKRSQKKTKESYTLHVEVWLCRILQSCMRFL